MTIPNERLRKAVEEFAETEGKEETRIDHPAIFEAMEDRADFAAELLILQPWAKKARKVLKKICKNKYSCPICHKMIGPMYWEDGSATEGTHAPSCAIAELLGKEK